MAIIRTRHIFDKKGFQYTTDIQFQLDAFWQYINITEELIEREVKEKIKSNENFLKDTTPVEIDLWHDFVDHAIKVHTRQLHYSSIFISIYSFFEKKMKQLCKIGEENQLIKINDMSGRGVVKYQKYLTKVLQLNLDTLKNEWELITRYNQLRNLLVHAPSNTLTKDNNGLIEKIHKIKSLPGLTIVDTDDTIEFEIEDKKLLLQFCKVVDRFLDYICNEKH